MNVLLGRRSILHIDMDAFYASIEQRDNSSYRGKPVVVGADPRGGKGRGVVSAASYEARVFGIRSAMPIRQAYRRCPSAIFLPVRMERYVNVSARIFEIFSRYTNLVEPLSLDEAFLDVTGSYALFGSAETIGRRIQKKIFREEQLWASVGVAPNKFLAKVASDRDKPKGFVVVSHEKIGEFLNELPLSCLWGVGAKTEQDLAKMGWRTIGDIAKQSSNTLRSRFGKRGLHVWQLANGWDDRPVISNAPKKSIGAEATFSQDTDDEARIRHTLLRLSEKVANRLFAEHVGARGITLKFRNADFSTVTRTCLLLKPIYDANTICLHAQALLDQLRPFEQKVRLLGLSGTKLTSIVDHEQLTLFELSHQRQEHLSSAIASIRTRFGQDAIQLGTILEQRKTSM